MNYISGDVVVMDDFTVTVSEEVGQGDVTIIADDELGVIYTGDQGPPGIRGNSVLYGDINPAPSVGRDGDFYINTVTNYMWGPKTVGIWFPPGVSLIGPQGVQGPPGPQGPMGAPGLQGNQIYYGAGPPSNSVGRPGDSYIDQTNHLIYGPKQADNTWPATGASLVGPPGPVGPAGPPAWATPPVPWAGNGAAYTSVAPASLVTNAGTVYVCTVSHISSANFSTDLSAGKWQAVGSAGGGGAGSTVYVGDAPPTGVSDNSLWWNTSDGCMYIYYNDGNSHQWVISSPVPDVSLYLPLSGGTLTGPLIQAADPVNPLGTATKQYVDSRVGGLTDAPSDGFYYGRMNAAWAKVAALGTGGGGGASVFVQDTAPASAPDGSLWWQSSTGLLFIRYNDGNTTQWVLTAGQTAAQAVSNALTYAAQTLTTPQKQQSRANIGIGIRGWIDGLILSTPGSSSSFGVSTGEAADSTNAELISLPNVFTKSTSAWVIGAGQGALDTGAIAASTWYHVHLIRRASDGLVDILISLSATAPTLPSGFTLSRRIGSMRTNASSQWTAFTQIGDEFLWTTQVTDAAGVSLTATAALFSLSVPIGIQVRAISNFWFGAGSTLYYIISSPDVADVAPSNTGTTTFDAATNASVFNPFSPSPVRTNTAGQIRARASGTTNAFWIITKGWMDSRGRNA